MRTRLVLRWAAVLALCVSTGPGGTAPAAAQEQARRSSDKAVVSIFGESGEPVTGATPRVWHSGRDAVTVTRSGEGVRVSARAAGSEVFEILLLPKAGDRFHSGGFFDATSSPTPGRPTLRVVGGDRACTGGSSGQFRVLDDSPDLTRLWILFEQRCTGAAGSSFGEIRFNVDHDRSLLMAPARVEFPRRPVGGADVTVPVTLINIGSEPITFGAPQLVGRPPTGGPVSFRIESNVCAMLQPRATCAIVVTYRPLFPGAVEASLVVPDSTRAGRHQMSLVGVAV